MRRAFRNVCRRSERILAQPMTSHGSGPIRSQLKHDDQQDLAWFFVEGAVAFDRSPIGAQLDAAELFTFGPMICAACQGAGYQGDPEELIVEAIEKARKLEDELAARGESLAVNLRRWRLEHGQEAPPWYDDGQCRVCNGSGWLPRRTKHGTVRAALTARPTGSSVNKRGGREPSSDVLERYGFVCRRLSRVPHGHRETLEAFFGLAGLRWAEDRFRGRIWGVMPLTPAGKKLVKQSRGKRDGGAVLTDDQILNVEAELEKQKPMKTRGELLKAAREQAADLFRAAEAAWRGDRPTLDAAKETLAKIRDTIRRIA